MLLLLILTIILIYISSGKEICLLCERGGNDLLSPGYSTTDGSTCTAKLVETAKYNPTSIQCKQAINKWRNICCKGINNIEPKKSKPESEIPEYQVTGKYPKCNICREGRYPYRTTMVINILYMKPGTCVNYYKEGMSGNIPSHICSALQYFAAEPCGCKPTEKIASS